jgi:hypothetical protein
MLLPIRRLTRNEEYIINHANLSIVFATAQHIPTLIALRPKIPGLKIIVSVDELVPQVKNVMRLWGKEKNIQIMDLTECVLIFHTCPLRRLTVRSGVHWSVA